MGIEFPRPIVSGNLGYENCETAIANPKGNNPFFLDRLTISGSVETGRYGAKINDFDVYNSVPSAFYRSTVQSPPTFVAAPTAFVNALFAKANPYRANILLPAFLAELRELPKMIYDLGRLKKNQRPIFHGPADLAKAWVGANFGWAPLVGDLMKIADFHLQTAKREKEFDRLYSSAGLVRRVKLGNSFSGGGSMTFSWGSYQFSRSLLATGSTQVETWGVVRYRPSRSSSGAPTRRPAPTELRRMLSGLTTDGAIASAWELLPWSWFIDYVYDVGTFLEANAGKRNLTVERACIMQHATCKMNHPGDAASDPHGRTAKLSPGTRTYEWKTRTPVAGPSALPQPHMPELSGVQLSILGSLTFLRSRGLK
jgi:hypothetical protein